ncbi:MAG: DUF167 domain-containing protein [bacterium]|nr:DUF167 domain-containing protein [bacterium]
MHIKVRVKTGMKKESLKTSGSRFEISVKEKAERNQANARVVALVAAHFKVRVKDVRIVSGHHSASKMLSVGRTSQK